MDEVAQAENLIPSYVTRLVRLTFLAPDITASILSGRHDPDLTVSRLMADTRFPLKLERPASLVRISLTGPAVDNDRPASLRLVRLSPSPCSARRIEAASLRFQILPRAQRRLTAN